MSSARKTPQTVYKRWRPADYERVQAPLISTSKQKRLVWQQGEGIRESNENQVSVLPEKDLGMPEGNLPDPEYWDQWYTSEGQVELQEILGHFPIDGVDVPTPDEMRAGREYWTRRRA